MLDLVPSRVGRDMSRADSAATLESVKGSRKIDWLSLSFGGTADCFAMGCAQSGITISTCLGVDLSVLTLAAVQSRPLTE